MKKGSIISSINHTRQTPSLTLHPVCSLPAQQTDKRKHPNRRRTSWRATSVSSTPGPARTVTETTEAAEAGAGAAAAAGGAAGAAAATGEGAEGTIGRGRRQTTGTRAGLEAAEEAGTAAGGRGTTSARGAIWASGRAVDFVVTSIFVRFQEMGIRGTGVERWGIFFAPYVFLPPRLSISVCVSVFALG